MKLNLAWVAGLALAATCNLGVAQSEKPLTIVVPTAAGGGNDAMARTIGQKLGVLLNRSVIVDNKAGANGALASEFVAKAAPDGNTVSLARELVKSVDARQQHDMALSVYRATSEIVRTSLGRR